MGQANAASDASAGKNTRKTHHPRGHAVDVMGPNRTVEPIEMTGAQAIVRSLQELGIESVFGLPGGAILPTYDPLLEAPDLNHVLVRHEQGAGHAAQGYAMVTGRPGVAIATSGPGATNLVTPLADAHMDSRSDGRDHRPGQLEGHRYGRVPGSRHRRHHDADHQALVLGYGRSGRSGDAR